MIYRRPGERDVPFTVTKWRSFYKGGWWFLSVSSTQKEQRQCDTCKNWSQVWAPEIPGYDHSQTRNVCEQCTCRGSGKPPLNIGLGNGLNLMLRRNISMKQTHSPEKLYWWAFCILKFSPPSSAKTNDQWQLWDSGDDQPPVWIIDIWLSSEKRTEFWRQSYYQQICLGPSPFHGIWITYYLTWSSLSTCICESYVLTVILLWCLFQGP